VVSSRLYCKVIDRSRWMDWMNKLLYNFVRKVSELKIHAPNEACLYMFNKNFICSTYPSFWYAGWVTMQSPRVSLTILDTLISTLSCLSVMFQVTSAQNKIQYLISTSCHRSATWYFIWPHIIDVQCLIYCEKVHL